MSWKLLGDRKMSTWTKCIIYFQCVPSTVQLMHRLHKTPLMEEGLGGEMLPHLGLTYPKD